MVPHGTSNHESVLVAPFLLYCQHSAKYSCDHQVNVHTKLHKTFVLNKQKLRMPPTHFFLLRAVSHLFECISGLRGHHPITKLPKDNE